MGMEMAPFSQIKTPVPRLPVLLTLSAGVLKPGQEQGEGFLGSQREVSFQPRAGQRESRAFFSAAPRPAGWATSRGCFSGRGTGAEPRKADFRVQPSRPRPGLPDESSSSWPPPARTLSPHARDPQSGRDTPGSRPLLRGGSAGTWFPTPRPPRRGAGAGRRAPRSRPGGGPGAVPGGEGRRRTGLGPGARGRRERSPRARPVPAPERSLPTLSVRPPRPPFRPRRRSAPAARGLGLPSRAVPAVAQVGAAAAAAGRAGGGGGSAGGDSASWADAGPGRGSCCLPAPCARHPGRLSISSPAAGVQGGPGGSRAAAGEGRGTEPSSCPSGVSACDPLATTPPRPVRERWPFPSVLLPSGPGGSILLLPAVSLPRCNARRGVIAEAGWKVSATWSETGISALFHSPCH